MMEVKEAIEFCKKELYYDFKDFLPDYQLEYNNKMKDTIYLLQQGEIDKEELKKVWQMWEELFKFFAQANPDDDFIPYRIRKIMIVLEQKYFPKEKNNENMG